MATETTLPSNIDASGLPESSQMLHKSTQSQPKSTRSLPKAPAALASPIIKILKTTSKPDYMPSMFTKSTAETLC